MEVIYAAPFVSLSLACFFACLLIPKMRPYLLEVSIAPVAFGLCSIVGVLAAVLISDYSGIHVTVLDEPVVGTSRLVIFFSIYMAFGLLGTWVAVRCASQFKARLMKLSLVRRLLCKMQP
jgi:hypothetical protein